MKSEMFGVSDVVLVNIVSLVNASDTAELSRSCLVSVIDLRIESFRV